MNVNHFNLGLPLCQKGWRDKGREGGEEGGRERRRERIAEKKERKETGKWGKYKKSPGTR